MASILKRSVIEIAPPGLVFLTKRQAIMGAIPDTAPAVQADIHCHILVLVDRIHRTGGNAFAAAYAELFPDDDAAPLALGKGTGRTGSSTGGWITGQAGDGDKPGRQSSG
jgi:hypothetical protein